MFLGMEGEQGQVPSIRRRVQAIGAPVGQVGHTHHSSWHHHIPQALRLMRGRRGTMRRRGSRGGVRGGGGGGVI